MSDQEVTMQLAIVLTTFGILTVGLIFMTDYCGWEKTAEREAKRNPKQAQDTACRGMRNPEPIPEPRRPLTTEELIHQLRCQVADLSDDMRRERHKSSSSEGSFGSPWLF